MRAASAFASVPSTSTSTTVTPSLCRRRAVSRPIPRAPPVMSAIFPCSSMCVIRPAYGGGSVGAPCRQFRKRAGAVVIGLEVELVRIHQHRMQAGPARADNVDTGHVADIPRVGGLETHRVEREVEDARIGLHH